MWQAVAPQLSPRRRHPRQAVGRSQKSTSGDRRLGGIMNVPKSVFRQYDVRGLVDRELTQEFAGALGRAMASLGWTKLGRAPVIAVGRDNRPSGLRLSEGFRRGIAQAGGTAIDIGEVPTPALYLAVYALEADG